MRNFGSVLLLALPFLPSSARAEGNGDAVLLALNGFDRGVGQLWIGTPILCYQARTGRTLSGNDCVRIVPDGARAKLASGGLITLQAGGHTTNPGGTALRTFRVRADGAAGKSVGNLPYAVWPPESLTRVHFHDRSDDKAPPDVRAALQQAALQRYHPATDAARSQMKEQSAAAKVLRGDFDGDKAADRATVLQDGNAGWDLFIRARDQGPFVHRYHERLTDTYSLSAFGWADLAGDGQPAIIVLATFEAEDWWLGALLPTPKGLRRLRMATPAFWQLWAW